MEWEFADAKKKLSELVARATTEGPQTIRHHNEAVIVVAEAVYQSLVGKRLSFRDWMLGGPRTDDLKLPPRKRSPMREVEL